MATPTQVKFAETNYGGAVTVSVIDVEAHSPGQQYLAADAQDAGPEIVLPPPLEPTQPPQNDASPAHNATSAGTRRSVRRSSSWLVKSRRRRPWKRLIRRELNWVTRYTMSGLLLAATPLMLGHFFYYMGLEGELVGDSFTQQKTRFFGNVFPYIVLAFIVSSVTIAYIQWLFFRLRKKPVAVRVVNAACGAAGSLFLLLDWELLTELPDIGVFALFIGLLAVPTTMVAPGTLTVTQTQMPNNVTRPVYPLAIADFNKSTYFELSRPANADGDINDKTSLLWLAYRTIMSRLTTASAASGAILRLPMESPNSTYPLRFWGPYVECEVANSTVAGIMEENTGLAAAKHQNASLVEALYISYVPYLNDSDPSRWGMLSDRTVDPSNASNELWFSFKRNSTDGAGWVRWPYPKCPITEYRVCKLYNASYDLTVSFQDGAMSVTHNNGKPQRDKEVSFPKRIVNSSDPYQLVGMAYASYMWAFTDLLVGSMGFYKEDVGGAQENITASFTSVDTRVRDTPLLGSNAFSCMFAFSWYFSNKTWDAWSDQREFDIDFAQNAAGVDELVPQMSANLTISLMNDQLLSTAVNSTVIIYSTVDVWAFHRTNLLLSYGAALLLSMIGNVLGWIAFVKNRVSIDLSVSTMMGAAPTGELFDVEHHARRGSLPLPLDVRDKRIQFLPFAGGGWGFHVVLDYKRLQELKLAEKRARKQRRERLRKRKGGKSPLGGPVTS